MDLTAEDRRAAARIASRIFRAEDGNLGDVKSVGDRVEEMRIDYGPGYRVYFIRRGSIVIVPSAAATNAVSRGISRQQSVSPFTGRNRIYDN